MAAERLKAKDGPLDIIPFNHPYSEAIRLWFMQYFDVGLVHHEGRWMTDWLSLEGEEEDAEFELEEPPLFKDEDFISEAL